MKKRYSIMWAFLPIIIMFAIQIAISFLGMEFVFMFQVRDFAGGSVMDLADQISEVISGVNFTSVISLLYAIVTGVLFGIWLYRLQHLHSAGERRMDMHDIAGDLKEERRGLFEGYRWTIIPGILLLAIGMQYISNYLFTFFASIKPDWLEFYMSLMKSMGLVEGGDIGIVVILYSVVFGPIVEELGFRGLTYHFAYRSSGTAVAVFLQALLFGIMHMNPLQGIYAFALGLVLGLIYDRCRNIYITISIHMIYNIMGIFLQDHLPMGDTAAKFFLILLGSLIVSYCGYQLIKNSVPKRINIEEKK